MHNKIAGWKKPDMLKNKKSIPPDGKKTSILIVDDAPATLELLERNLSSAGYKILRPPMSPKPFGSLNVSLLIW